jgi:hypothetical protein
MKTFFQVGHGVYGDEHANRLKKVVYPPRLMVDFTNLGVSCQFFTKFNLILTVCICKHLQFDALKRYAQFYNLNIRDEYDEEELAAVVARHFDCSLEVDEDESIVSFIQRVRNGEKSSSSKRSSEKDRNKDKKRKKSNSRKRQRDSASSSSHSAPTSSSNKKESSKKKEDASEDNELYCICNLPSYGNMIACDGKKCPNPSQWYHLECVGLADGRHPDTWYV